MTIYERIMRRDLDGLVDVNPETGCWEWVRRRNGKSYGLVDVVIDGVHTTRRAHRLVFEAFTGVTIPDGLDVLHLCDHAPCCNPSHHALGTNAANHKDAAMKRAGTGRHAGSVAA